LHSLIVSANPARLAELHVDDFAGGELHDVEHRFRIARHVGWKDDVAPNLRLDAANVVGVRLCARRVHGHLLLCPLLALRLGPQRFGFARLSLSSLGESLLLLAFRLAFFGFLLFALPALALSLRLLLF